ncbi:MAG: Radical SAM domain heme biosynthesis protein [Candidatus Jettenia ecosi]|uniref:Radical SAM domain heme biosynthesis protein n=1 Tax=Candidatus Jettenia ecosi TaxID=2494326 RepID=A0A533QE90_9BACT|nr:MAG: Radical SAM domain heme biosynthesis protein [Candidatus Jettenia ecosi]
MIILSNATLIDSFKAKRLKELNVTQVEVSLYAMDEKIHDSITGIKGSHVQTMEGIHRLKEEGVSVRIKCTIMEQNYAEYTKIGEFAKKLGIRFSSSPVVSPRLDGSQDTYEYCTDPENLRSYFLQWGKENKEKYKDFKESPSVPLDKSFICSAGRTSCAITPDGYLKPCTMLPVKLGNLLEKSFKELWQVKPKRLVKDIRDAKMSDFSSCKECKWNHLCSPCPGVNYLETGNMFTVAEGYCNKVKSIMNELDIESNVGKH